MSVTTAQAISLLENVLFESATLAKANAASWVSLSNLNSSYSTVSGLAGAMASTAEATIAQQVIRYYEGALGRSPSGAEVAYYVNIIENGNTAAGIPAMTTAQITEGTSGVPAATWNEIASFFAASPEFAFASAGSNVVNLLYLNILGRAPSAAEVTYYQNLLSSGTTVSTLVQYFTTSPEYQTKVDASIISDLSTYGTTVANGGTTPSSIGTVGSTTSTTTTAALTTSVDTPTVAGSTTVSGTFNGTASTTTFTAGDSIVASGSGNVLSLSDLATSGTAENATNNATSVVGATVSGVQTLVISASEGVYADTTTSSEGLTGLTALTIKAIGSTTTTTDGDGVEVIAGSSVNVTATDLSAGAANESILGGNNVSLTVAGVTTGGTITVGSTTQAATGTVTVVATEKSSETTHVADSITVTGGTTVSVTANLAGAVNNTITGGVIVVNGTTATTSVSVTQTAATTATSSTSGVVDGAVTVKDAASTSTTTANTITSVTLVNYGNSVIDDNALTTLSLTGGTGTLAITTAGSGTGSTSLNLNLTSLTGGTITDINNEITTLTIVNSGKSSLTFADTGLTTVKISGTGNVTSDLTDGGVNTNVATVTDSVTGVSKLTLGTSASFDGTGSGQDVITLSGVTSGTIKGGSATNNQLILAFTGTGVTSLGTVSGFTSLGFNASSGGTYDLSSLTGFTSFELSGNVGAALTLASATAGSPLAIDKTQSNVISYNTVDTSGASDSIALTLGTSSGSGITVAGLDMYDSNTTTVGGTGTVSIASTYANAGYVNVITLLDTASVAGSGISSLTVTGNASLQVGTWDDFAASLKITNNSTSSTANSFSLTDTKLTSLTFAGTTTGATALTLTDSVAAGFTLTDSGTSAVTLTDSGLTAATSLTVTDSATAALTLGATSDTALTSVSLTNSGSATLTANDINNGAGTVFTTLTIAGTGAITLGTSAATGLTLGDTTASVTVTDSDTGAVIIGEIHEASGTTGALTISDTGSGALTISTLSDASSGTLTITKSGAGTVAVGGTASTISAAAIHLTDSNTSGSLSLGSSTVTFTDATATSVVGSGTGKESLYLTDADAAAITVDFSGSSASDVVSVTRGAAGVQADIYKVGNGNNTLTISYTNATGNTDTISFGSGADTITDAIHTTGVHAYINTAATGLNTVNAFSAITNFGGTANTDTLKFVGNTVASVDSTSLGTFTSVGAGVAAALAGLSQNEAGSFVVGANTYIFDHGGSSSSALSATDSMVELVGTTTALASSVASGVITLHS